MPYRQIEPPTQQMEQKKERMRKHRRSRRLMMAAMIATAFVLGCILGNRFTKADVRDVDNEPSFTESEPGYLETVTADDKPAEVQEEQNLITTQIPEVVVGKPVDYSLKQAVKQLELLAESDEQYQSILERKDDFPEKLLINLANNPEMIDFVANYEGITSDDSSAILTEEELSKPYPLFLQWDRRWGAYAYGDNSNIAISGCGPTTLSMAVVALTRNAEATPAAIAKYAMENGFYLYGTGTKWSLMTDGAAAYGVQSEQINISQNGIKNALDAGKVVICSVRKGDFTTGGHFIMLYGYDEEGFYVNDPFCVYKSGQKWNYSRLKSQMKAVWTLGV